MQAAEYIGIENVEVTVDDSANAWALWDSALVQGDTKDLAAAPEDCALEVINQHHAGLAQAIRSFWGHPECCAFIETLLLDGTTAQQKNRCGFSQEVAACMLQLINIHEQLFGSFKDSATGGAPSWF